MSAAPGTGTATRAAAATSKAWNIPIPSPTNCSRTGAGPSATARSPRSCAISTTSPTASTCGATSNSTRGSEQARVRRRARAAGRSGPTRAARKGRRHRAISGHGDRQSVDAAHAELPGAGELPRANGTTPGCGRMTGLISPGCASASIGTGSSGVQSIPIIARAAKHLYVFQRTANFTLPARNAPLDPAREQAHKADYPERRRAAYETPFGIAGYPAAGKIGARCERGGTAPRLRGEMGRRRQHQLSLFVQRPAAGQGVERHRRRNSSARKSAPRSRTRRPPSCCARTIIRSAPSG